MVTGRKKIAFTEFSDRENTELNSENSSDVELERTILKIIIVEIENDMKSIVLKDDDGKNIEGTVLGWNEL